MINVIVLCFKWLYQEIIAEKWDMISNLMQWWRKPIKMSIK